MISSFFGVKREKPQEQPPTTIRFDRRLLQQTPPPQKTNLNDPQLLDIVLKKLEQLAVEQLGESSAPQLQQLSASLKQQLQDYLLSINAGSNEQIEKSLIETKQKYNELVDTLNTNRMKLKTFHDSLYSSIENFLIVVGELLQTKQFQAPLRHIHKGLTDISSETVDRYMNYAGKILVQEQAKAIDRAMEKRDKDHQEEARGMKITAKAQDAEVHALRENKKALEKQVKDLETSKKELTQKLKQTEQSVKMAEQLGGQLLKQKSQLVEKQLTAKLKSAQQRIQFLDTTNKQLQGSTQTLHSRIQSLQKLIEQQKLQHRYGEDAGQKKYLASIKKLNQEKLAMQQTIAELNIEIKKLKTEQFGAISEALSENTKLITTMQTKIDTLQGQITFTKSQYEKIQNQHKKMVDKELIRGLVEGFMDEGKQWSIKKDIQRNLFAMLGVHQEKEEPKKSGWFGFF